MFPKYNSFYLTGLFEVLCEIWHIYYITVGNHVTIDVMLNPFMGAAIFIFLHAKRRVLPFNEINEHFLED